VSGPSFVIPCGKTIGRPAALKVDLLTETCQFCGGLPASQHRSIGGWHLNKRGDFDQQLIARLTAIETPGDPCQLDSPSWIFRRGGTNAYRGQALMRVPEDEMWYSRFCQTWNDVTFQGGCESHSREACKDSQGEIHSTPEFRGEKMAPTGPGFRIMDLMQKFRH
jgi:hypothetical protein